MIIEITRVFKSLFIKLVLTIFGAIIFINSYGQKILKNEVDKFNGSKYVCTTQEKIYKDATGTYLNVDASYISDKEDSYRIYTLTFMFKAKSVLSLKKGDKSYFKAEDGDILTIQYDSKYKTYYSSDEVWYYCPVSDKELKFFMEKKVTDIRFESSSYNRDFEIKGKFRDVLPKVCKLILNN